MLKKSICLVLCGCFLFLFPLSAAAQETTEHPAAHLEEMSEDILRTVTESETERSSEAATILPPSPPTAEPVRVVDPSAEAPATEPSSVPPASEAEATTAPSAAPTTEPTTAPTTEPTEVPTTEPTTAPTPKVICYGDLDENGNVSTGDAREVLRFCVRLRTLTGRQCRLADMDKSGSISSSDARAVLRTAVRLTEPQTFPVGTYTDDTTVYAIFDKRKPYTPSHAGFSTNIQDPLVFDALRELENYCASFGRTLTFYYTDVEQTYYIQYNSNRVFRTQCTIKAPYVKSMLAYMEANHIPLSTQLTLRNSQKWNGHPLSDYPAGTRFTIQKLITHTLRYSDNTSYQMLFDYFGNAHFNETARKAGAKLRLGSYIFGETTAADMANLFLDLYRYDGIYRDFLFNEMENNTSRNRIAAGVPSGIRVINKMGSGSNMTLGYHDTAVIFTEIPCVLVIYTTFNFDRNYDKVPFREVASRLVAINRKVEYF